MTGTMLDADRSIRMLRYMRSTKPLSGPLCVPLQPIAHTCPGMPFAGAALASRSSQNSNLSLPLALEQATGTPLGKIQRCVLGLTFDIVPSEVSSEVAGITECCLHLVAKLPHINRFNCTSVILMQLYLSPEQAKAMHGNNSQGPVYKPYEAIGPQPESKFATAPAPGFGTAPRSLKSKHGNYPGPGRSLGRRDKVESKVSCAQTTSVLAYK
eukprot:1151454-Pelagomonas_calceolata.AAC.3